MQENNEHFLRLQRKKINKPKYQEMTNLNHQSDIFNIWRKEQTEQKQY